jgi:hypothetical protein
MPNNRELKKLRRNGTSITLIEENIQNLISSYQFLTQADMPENVSAFINDMGYLASAPVTSVNDQTGAVFLSLFSGNYSDLVGKPTLFSGAYADLTGKPALFSGNYIDLTNKPTLFSGSYNDLSDKPTIPTVRRMETFSGVTDASGNFTVTYSSPFPLAPHVSPQLISATPSQVVRITSSTVNGFTVNVTNRASVTLLALEVLLAATTPVVGAAVSVTILARS